MKNYSILFIVGFLLNNFLFSQTHNWNPDPNDEPWTSGPQPVVTSAMLSTLTLYQVPSNVMLLTIPAAWDNTQETDYFPGILNQGTYNSCAQAAGIGYTFTYEINRVKQVAASTNEHKYHHHFTWNFLNYGGNNGSWTPDGWDIIINNGIPPKSNYIEDPDEKEWHTGFNDYYIGTKNSIAEDGYMPLSDISDLEEVKNYLYTHGELDSDEGGLAVFYKNSGFTYATATVGGTPGNNQIIKAWGTSDLHAMTIVGYDDGVGYDYNGNGTVENVGDLGNWELGCFIVANSWGTGWLNDGFAYVP
jgi:hypothetical protein